ncbi:protein FAM90A27P-like [Sus scrofa]|uniref:protein FAM90A27P-like n=1 Tax=Sus scrofa TaxID=9823 RepID=UPI000A2AF8FC|nr:protein FAM90A27P-like [Sus scrofa]
MSKWCPVKCWSRASAPPLLGSKEKENLEPRNPLALQTLGPFSKTDRKKEPGPRQEERERNPLPRPFPKRPQEKKHRPWHEPEELCAFLRQPTRPMPVGTSRKRSAPSPVLTGQTLAKKPSRTGSCPM